MSTLKKGFDTKKYIAAELGAIKKRARLFECRLYLEIGGKLYADNHAARVLPSYAPDTKVRLLKKLNEKIDIVHCISTKMIESGKMRGDSLLLYSDQLIKDIEDLESKGLESSTVFISRISESTRRLAEKMKRKIAKEDNGLKILLGYEIADYPNNIKIILSDKGYGRQDYFDTKSRIVVITAPGPGSGKMAFCMAQMYKDRKHEVGGIKSGYAKLETFPVWNLPLNHPVNIAYEAATADIGDYNVIDRFHKQAYGISAVNYNRDVKNFEILKKIIDAMTAENDPLRNYKSPTDMGIGMTKVGITNDRIVREAAKAEIIRRYNSYREGFAAGYVSKETLGRMEKILEKSGFSDKADEVLKSS